MNAGSKNPAYKHGDATRNGMAPEYRAWHTMRRRCYEKRFISYNNYGGRGIRVCPRWLDKNKGYQNFLRDVGRKPSPVYSLDRIDVNGDYVPSNVRWATRKMQNRNKSNTIYVAYGGITHNLTDLAERNGMKPVTLYNRLYRGVPIKKAVETPVGKLWIPPNSLKTRCPQNHKYSGYNLVRESNGNRKCRICRKNTARKHREKAKRIKTDRTS